MGAAASVNTRDELALLNAEELGNKMAELGEEYVVYKDGFISKNIDVQAISSLSHNEKIQILKDVGVQNDFHRGIILEVFENIKVTPDIKVVKDTNVVENTPPKRITSTSKNEFEITAALSSEIPLTKRVAIKNVEEINSFNKGDDTNNNTLNNINHNNNHSNNFTDTKLYQSIAKTDDYALYIADCEPSSNKYISISSKTRKEKVFTEILSFPTTQTLKTVSFPHDKKLVAIADEMALSASQKISLSSKTTNSVIIMSSSHLINTNPSTSSSKSLKGIMKSSSTYQNLSLPLPLSLPVSVAVPLPTPTSSILLPVEIAYSTNID